MPDLFVLFRGIAHMVKIKTQAGELSDPQQSVMSAVLTRPDPAVTAYLQSFARYGVPLDLMYGPGTPQGIALPELLTSATVMDAFRRAAPGGIRDQEAAE